MSPGARLQSYATARWFPAQPALHEAEGVARPLHRRVASHQSGQDLVRGWPGRLTDSGERPRLAAVAAGVQRDNQSIPERDNVIRSSARRCRNSSTPGVRITDKITDPSEAMTSSSPPCSPRPPACGGARPSPATMARLRLRIPGPAPGGPFQAWIHKFIIAATLLCRRRGNARGRSTVQTGIRSPSWMVMCGLPPRHDAASTGWGEQEGWVRRQAPWPDVAKRHRGRRLQSIAELAKASQRCAPGPKLPRLRRIPAGWDRAVRARRRGGWGRPAQERRSAPCSPRVATRPVTGRAVDPRPPASATGPTG